MIRALSLLFPVLFAFAGPVFAAGTTTILNYHLPFEDFKFLDQDFVARSGLKSSADRGLELTEGKFGKGLILTREPRQDDNDNLSGTDVDLITAVTFNTMFMRESVDDFNEPILWGAGKVNPQAGSVAFWVRGTFREGAVFEQTACAWGRKERDLLAVTVEPNGCLGAYLVDARYVKHAIVSPVTPTENVWMHIALNWDRARGLELFVDGKSVASSWGKDPWWETALPGLLHFPMPRVAYDEAYFFGRPLGAKEIDALMKTNTPPPRVGTVPERTPEERDLLVRALGISSRSLLPVLTPAEPGKTLVFREVEPVSMGDGHVPAPFCHDGRYELAWPHPIAVFTIIPGDADFTAEKLDIDPPAGTPFNYVTLEGNLSKLTVYTNCKRTGDTFSGETLIAPPDSGNGFFHGEMVDRKSRGRITLPFLKGYGVPEGFRGDVRLPLTGETRVHEVSFFDVASADDTPAPGEVSWSLSTEGDLTDRYNTALNMLYPAADRSFLIAFRTPNERPAKIVDTGYLRRTHILTAPLTGSRAFEGVTLDLPMKTIGEDLLLVRLRDSAVPSRIWTHAEVKLKGFEGAEKRLRLRLEFTPFMLDEGDRVWLELSTVNNAKIRVGGPDGARIVLRPAQLTDAWQLWEKKALLPAVAEYGRMFNTLPWGFEKIAPDFLAPQAFGGPFDMVFPAQAVKRILPWSRLAGFYLEYTKPGYVWGNPSEPEKMIPLKPFAIPAGTPRWAWYQQKIQSFRYRVLEWAAANQNPDGQFGGGWNDDNDMLAGKLDLFLDGSTLARAVREREDEGLLATGYLEDGYCRIDPIDRLHVSDLFHDRFRDIIFHLGDPERFRRSLRTAWRWDKPSETPLNWGEGESFLFDKGIVDWYWGKAIPAAFSLADTATVTTRLHRLASYCDDLALWRFTEARLHTDCQAMYDEALITSMIIGGSADSTVSAEWLEGGGEDLSRWITRADTSSFECRMFSFDPLQRKVTARLFRLRPGIYEVKLSEDLGGVAGRALYTGDFSLGRFETFSVLIPSAKPVLLTVRLVNPDVGGPMPDLALAGYDCIRSKDRLWVRVSNLGGVPSGKSAVRLYDESDREIAEQKLPEIPAPLDYVEKSVWVTFEKIPEKGKLRLVADPQVKMKELFKGNNSVVVE